MKHPLNLNVDLIRFFENTPDLVCIAGRDGYFKNVNQAVIQKLGYTQEELFAHPISHFVHPDDAELTARKRKELLGGEMLMDFENRYLTKSGSVVWLHWTSVYFAESELAFAIAKDVTRRKQKELALEERFVKFKTLVSHFKSSLEKDKKVLAVELHEELAQLAAVVKADVHWLKTYFDDGGAAVQERIEHALSAAELLIRSIRKLSYSISPNMMGDVGFADTLQWLCEDFTTLHGIPCSLALFCEEGTLPQDVKTDLFRICQEALNSFIVQAQPKNVTVLLEQTGARILLTISDDGAGYDPGALNAILAATSLRERADSLHGIFSVESRKGRGTTLTVSFSLENYDRAPAGAS